MSAPSSRAGGHRLDPIDYDLHGVVGIRLVGATPGDARAVARQLGPLRRTLERDPDIVLRFVDDLSPGSPLRYLGVDDSAFTDDAFLVLQSRHRANARVKIPFEQVGGRCEIVCESGLPAVPLLIATINLTALSKGLVPLHASAFVYRGTGVLVTGWSKGGKTEALLAFASRGARYLGDEWIYLAADGSRMYGIPQPIRVWDWHLAQFAEYRERIGWRNRSRLRAIRLALAVSQALSRNRRTGTVLDRVQALVKRQTYVDVAPERLFGPFGSLEGPLDRVFFVASSATPHFLATPIDSAEVACRMVHSVRYEFTPLLSHYLMFKFAFPRAKNERLALIVNPPA